jgi:DNA-binding winged helix-turn-helix (wHTH) protein/Flp pilus assembly protein TadD
MLLVATMAAWGRAGLMNDRFSADVLPRGRQSGPPRSPWPIDLAHVRPFVLGDTEVRPASREVANGERREVVEPLVMQVLVALASARGETLSRDDLIAACWGGRAVTDDAINRVMSRLRTLARQFGGFRIETITKVGYRLVQDPAGTGPLSMVDRAQMLVSRRGAMLSGGLAVTAAAGAWLLASAESVPGTDPEIARLLARARAAAREGMPDDMARAASLYRLAIDKEPDNAEAWGGLAAVYRFQWEFSPPEEAPAMAARAKSAAARALEIDPGNGGARATLAGLVPMFGNWAKAEAEMRPVLAAYPDELRVRFGRLLAETGRLREALGHVRQAVAADPDVPRVQNFHARLLQDNGRNAEAEAALTAALDRWPRHLLLWFSRFHFLAYTGRPQMALAFAAERNGRPIGVPGRVFDIVSASARALATRAPADLDSAVRLHKAAIPEGAAFAENAVTFFSAIGRLDDAFDVLNAYYFGHGPAISDSRYGHETATYTPRYNRQCYFLFYAPSAPLRADPRFAELVREIGLEDYWRATGTLPDYRRAA